MKSHPSPSLSPLILMVCYSYVVDDPRVMTSATALTELGYRVQVFGLALREGMASAVAVGRVSIGIAPLIAPRGGAQWGRALWRWLRGDLREVNVIPAEQRSTSKVGALFFNLWLLRLALGLKISAVHCHTHSPLPAAWLIARLKRVPLIYDSAESVPHLLQALPDRRINRLIGRMESFMVRHAEAVITVGERLAALMQQRGARRVVIVGNWKRLSEYEVRPEQAQQRRQELGLEQAVFSVGYFGVLDPERSITPLLQAVKLAPDVILLISGHGASTDEVKAAAAESPNIRWLGWIPMSDLPLYTHLVDVIYYSLDPALSLQAAYSTPNKLFEAFAAGKALLVRRNVGEIGEIVERTQTGFLLESPTADALRAAFESLRDPAVRGTMQARSFAQRNHYSFETTKARLKQLYGDLVGESHHA